MANYNKKNELEKILNKYDFVSVCSVGDIDVELLGRIVCNAQSFERPDAYCVVDDTLYIIEHFEFDSYQNSKKGSKYKNEESEDFHNLIENMKDGESSLCSNIKSNSSFKYYVDNFIRGFSKHYNCIESYKEALKLLYPNINKYKVWFFIEDGNPIAPMVNNEHTCSLVHPLQFQRIRTFLEDKEKVDGIVIGANSGDGINKMLFIKRDSYYNVDTFIVDENEEIFGTRGRKISYIKNMMPD